MPAQHQLPGTTAQDPTPSPNLGGSQGTLLGAEHGGGAVDVDTCEVGDELQGAPDSTPPSAVSVPVNATPVPVSVTRPVHNRKVPGYLDDYIRH